MTKSENTNSFQIITNEMLTRCFHEKKNLKAVPKLLRNEMSWRVSFMTLNVKEYQNSGEAYL